jgi:hypothetical protein
MKALFPYFDVYREAVNKKGNATNAEKSFKKGLLPNLARVVLHDGAILSENCPVYECCHALAGIGGYIKWRIDAHHVLKILNCVYEN